MLKCLALLPLVSLLLGAGRGLAVEVWYDFEGDSGDVVTDKLVGDGAQDGFLEGVTEIQSSQVLFGSQSAEFGIPQLYSTFEVPGSTALGDAFTIAAHVENREAVPDFTRFASSFRGTGPVGTDRILVDFDASGTLIPGIRAVVNNTAVVTGSVPAGMGAAGYHHFALTVDAGLVTIYFDGSPVATGNVGLGYSNTLNLRIGEDPHDAGGTGEEQLIGNVDDLLVISRALSAGEIASLAAGSVQGAVTPMPGEYAVHYDFEGDLADRFTAADGAQDGIAHRAAVIDTNPSNAAFGSGSGSLDLPATGPYGRIDMGPFGNLGDTFTLSATVDYPQAGHSDELLTRLFSTHVGSGSPAGALIFDFDPGAAVGFGVRLVLPDGTIVTAPSTTPLNVRHTFTATYDAGAIRIYLDGVHIANGSTSGDVDLGSRTLYFGEDSAGPINENFVGTLDDAFLVGRVLTPLEVLQVHQSGAANVIPEPSSVSGLVAGSLALLLCARRRRCRPRRRASSAAPAISEGVRAWREEP